MVTADLETSEITGTSATVRANEAQFAWRILMLMNMFRLVLSVLLFAAYWLLRDPWVVGESDPGLALAALLALLTFSSVQLVLLRQRAPSAAVQTYLQFAADLISITLLVHASGGISSGIGGLLIIAVGGPALLVPADRAFLLAALTTLALLIEQSVAQLSGLTTAAQFAPAGILGAVVFVITAVVQLLRRQILETAALAEQRGVDLRNVVELNEYIIQHLRESIVVVDGDDQVRLINASAVKQLGIERGGREGVLRAISPDLAQQLDRWRSRATIDRTEMAFP